MNNYISVPDTAQKKTRLGEIYGGSHITCMPTNQNHLSIALKLINLIIYDFQHLTVLDYKAYLRKYGTEQMGFSLLFSPASP